MTRYKDHQLINQNSGNVELYTPPYIVEAVREVLGIIDLDPASCATANQTVNATRIFTKENEYVYGNKTTDLDRVWGGLGDRPAKVYMNHPYGRKTNALWINKLIHEYTIGNVSEAICLVFASTSEGWFQPLFNYPICFITGRVKHLNEQGEVLGSSTKGSCLVYLGDNVEKFCQVMSKLGRVMLPANRGM